MFWRGVLGYLPVQAVQGLAGLGAVIAAQAGFADHHAYTGADEVRLLRLAAAHDALLITTAKDFVRLPPTSAELPRRGLCQSPRAGPGLRAADAGEAEGYGLAAAELRLPAAF